MNKREIFDKKVAKLVEINKKLEEIRREAKIKEIKEKKKCK